MELKNLFEPKSIAVIGASRDINSVGYGVLYNLLNGGVFRTSNNQPFNGKVYAVNPIADEILGIKCNKSVKEIKEDIDLAIIIVPAKFVLQTTKECVQKKVKAIIIISAGFSELGEEGKKLQDEIALITKKAGIALVGPNCLGIINTIKPMNASFSPAMPPKGDIAFISQSGALADSVIDWAIEKNYGFSKLISYGNAAGLDVTEFIEYLSNDNETKAIAIYIESVKDGRKFMEAAKQCKKPIVAIKAGKTEFGVKAVSSHTGSLAGSYEIYKAAFNQSGIYIAESVSQLFESAMVMAELPKLKGEIAIVTNGGGAGVLTADYCAEFNLPLAKLDKKTIEMLDKSGKMHPAWSRSNPLDLVGDALPERYEIAINAVLKQKNVGGLIMLQTLQTMTEPIENAKILVAAKEKFPEKPIIAVYMGGQFTRLGRDYLKAHKVPVFTEPLKAVQAMHALSFKK